MSQPEPSAEQSFETIYEYAAIMMHAGLSAREIQNKLVGDGVDAKTAGDVVVRLMRDKSDALHRANRNAIKNAGKKNMIYGGLWCMGGLAVTAVTYLEAAGKGGGAYVITWGAILFGAGQFIHGLMQSSGREI